MRGYAICTTPRSGSNFLGQLLESTDKLGRPREYFNGPARRRLDDPAYPDAPGEQIARILSDGATANGVYALKAFSDQWRVVAAQVRLTEALPDLRFVRLVRNDVLAQAISWSIALQTEQYRSTQPARAAPRYDGALILTLLQRLILLDADWTQFFARTGLPCCMWRTRRSNANRPTRSNASPLGWASTSRRASAWSVLIFACSATSGAQTGGGASTPNMARRISFIRRLSARSPRHKPPRSRPGSPAAWRGGRRRNSA